jgi:GMP reductase
MKIETKEYLNYSDVLIKPKPTLIGSRADVDIFRQVTGYKSRVKIDSTGIVISNMDTVGTIEMAQAVQNRGLLVALNKFYGVNDLRVAFTGPLKNTSHFISIGQSELDLLKYRLLYADGIKQPLMIDVANGYNSNFFEFLCKVRKEFPDVYLCAGNVATPEILREYKDAGVDCVKIGIGPGGQCRTRETAGVGIPQLTAVLDCIEEAYCYQLHIMADGGINEYADFVKALGTGAQFVMAGSFFAGASEASGDWCVKGDTMYRKVYGMSSHSAQEKYYGEVKDYRASEGRTSLVPTTGPVDETVTEILGSLRSAMTYTNSQKLSQFPNNVTFIKVQDTINRKYEKFTIGT